MRGLKTSRNETDGCFYARIASSRSRSIGFGPWITSWTDLRGEVRISSPYVTFDHKFFSNWTHQCHQLAFHRSLFGQNHHRKDCIQTCGTFHSQCAKAYTEVLLTVQLCSAPLGLRMTDLLTYITHTSRGIEIHLEFMIHILSK